MAKNSNMELSLDEGFAGKVIKVGKRKFLNFIIYEKATCKKVLDYLMSTYYLDEQVVSACDLLLSKLMMLVAVPVNDELRYPSQ